VTRSIPLLFLALACVLQACAGAPRAADAPPTAPPRVCPSRALPLDARACAAQPPRGLSAQAPLEWGPTEGINLWSGRLRCLSGAVPARRRVGEGGLAPASDSPRSRLGADPELLELWELSCPGQTPLRLYVNPHRCGLPCPPPGLAVTDLRVEAAIQSAHAGLQADRPQDALEWARLAARQAPTDEVVQATLGHAALMAHVWPEAIAAFEAVLAVDGTDPTARLGLALARVQAIPAGKGLRIEAPAVVAHVSEAVTVRHAHVYAADLQRMDQLGAQTGTLAIEERDLAQGAMIQGEMAFLRADDGWLRKALATPAAWEQLRDVLHSGEAREETWVRFELTNGQVQDVQRTRGPQGFSRQLLADPAQAWRMLRADLDVHEASLPEAWASEHIHSEVSVPLLLAATMALLGAELQNHELPPEQVVVLAGEPWQGAWFETVSLARLVRIAREDPDEVHRQEAAQFLGQVIVAADAAVDAFLAGGQVEAAAARSPALFRGALVVRELDAALRLALGLAEPPKLPAVPMDARPDARAFRRPLVPLPGMQSKPPRTPRK
jgi:hypothetical protein